MITRKVKETQGDTIYLATGLHQDIVRSYNAISRNADGALVEISTRLKKVFDREACSLQKGVCEAVRAAVASTLGSCAGAPDAVEKSLRKIVGRASGTRKSTRPEVFSSHTANPDAYIDAFNGHARSTNVLHAASMFNLPGTHDPPGASGYGA